MTTRPIAGADLTHGGWVRNLFKHRCGKQLGSHALLFSESNKRIA